MIVKSELIYETWKSIRSEVEKNKVEKTINTFINIIEKEISEGNIVKIDGFGKFFSYSKKTKGINISNGNIQEIPNAKYIKFVPSSKLKK